MPGWLAARCKAARTLLIISHKALISGPSTNWTCLLWTQPAKHLFGDDKNLQGHISLHRVIRSVQAFNSKSVSLSSFSHFSPSFRNFYYLPRVIAPYSIGKLLLTFVWRPRRPDDPDNIFSFCQTDNKATLPPCFHPSNPPFIQGEDKR